MNNTESTVGKFYKSKYNMKLIIVFIQIKSFATIQSEQHGIISLPTCRNFTVQSVRLRKRKSGHGRKYIFILNTRKHPPES